MSSFVNPLKPRGGNGYADALVRIRSWAKARFPEGDPVISITELVCAEPGCPPRETVILVMRLGQPALKAQIHLAMVDVSEQDVVTALETTKPILAQARRAE